MTSRMPDIIDLSSDDEDYSKKQDSKSAAGGQSKDNSSRPRIDLPSCPGGENISSSKLAAKQEPQKNFVNMRQENKNGRAAWPEHVSTTSFDLQHQNRLHPSVVTTNGSVQIEPGTPTFVGPEAASFSQEPMSNGRFSRHFWRAGEYQGKPSGKNVVQGAMDHVRVHPKFLHSNATSHKWALGAIAELLDNAIDEVHNGATFVKVDKIVNSRDNSPALRVQDDGGGMDPDCMRHCMSLGYSRKNTNTMIGQYGNGFKTSTMRLGADVIVFSRCLCNGSLTQSIGLLSYTFLRETGHEDTIVPMVDFELPANTEQPRRLLRTTEAFWCRNLETILQWSPYSSEDELLQQFEDISSHGTKIVVYNLWLNDDGVLELDFDSDKMDIQLRGSNKQEKPDKSQSQLTQQHISNRFRYSLRAYTSMLYLQMPTNFQIILRGTPVEHHSIANDLKFPEYIIYKPQIGGSIKDFGYKEISVITTIGFTKEAPMVNVHGFNVYHKNRLIMPFWKVLQENSSRGRGVVGVLEANFIEPAHDKQDFEKTALLLRLETRLKQMTIEYWNLHCELIGYQRNTPRNRQNVDAGSVVAGIPITAHGTSIVALPHPFATAGISAVVSQGPGISTFQYQQSPHSGPGIRMPAVVQDANISHEGARDMPEGGVYLQSSELFAEQKPSFSTESQKHGVPGNQRELQSSSVLETLNVSSLGTSRKELEGNIRNSDLGGVHDRFHPNATSVQPSGSSECAKLCTSNNHPELAETGPVRVKTQFCEDDVFKRKIIDLDPLHTENAKRRRGDYLMGSDIDQKATNQGENGQVNARRPTEQNIFLVSDASQENMVKIVEDNRQLKSRCVEYERREKELEQMVNRLESELLESKTKYIELLKKLDDQKHLQAHNSSVSKDGVLNIPSVKEETF